MKYTNKYGLPEYIVKHLLRDEYDYIPNTYSATMLAKPARATVLQELYDDDIEVDVSELIASSYGTALHDSFYLSIKDFTRAEERLSFEIDGATVTGKFDFLWDGVLHDIKSTSVWSYVYDSRTADYTKQLSVYALLLAENGIEIKSDNAIIDFFFTDWKKSDARRGNGYPALRYASKQVPLMDYGNTHLYITSRLSAIREARLSLPYCTPEERWQKPDQYAVKREGRKSAVAVLDTYKEAKARAEYENNQPKCKGRHTVELRAGSAARCEYCFARSVCEQYVNDEFDD